jgi:hypothetical protein
MIPTKARQITQGDEGRILTNCNVWSPDSKWIVFDTRSDPAGSIFDGTRIQRVSVETGAIETLYQSSDGACCGVATCHPSDGRVVFILGPRHPKPPFEYKAWNRQGVFVRPETPGKIEFLEATDLSAPFTPGALRGGTHVHTWSPDGLWVSFTYEDHILANRDSRPGGQINQRNVGVCVPVGYLDVPATHPRNQAGTHYACLVTSTTANPKPGSDEIERAYEDAWIGEEGYIDASGLHHPKALAFLGDLRGRDGRKWTEVFVCDLPPFPWVPGEDPLEGSVEKRPSPPAGTTVWRLTHTDSLPRPGIQGPRHWPRSDRTGRWIAALLLDPQSGLPQLHRIDILDGSITQVTFLPEGVGSCFTWNPAGDAIACASGKQIVVLDPFERRVVAQSEIFDQPPRPEAVVFSPCGTKIAFTLPTLDTDAAVRNQVWCLELRQ